MNEKVKETILPSICYLFTTIFLCWFTYTQYLAYEAAEGISEVVRFWFVALLVVSDLILIGWFIYWFGLFITRIEKYKCLSCGKLACMKRWSYITTKSITNEISHENKTEQVGSAIHYHGNLDFSKTNIYATRSIEHKDKVYEKVYEYKCPYCGAKRNIVDKEKIREY